MFNKIIPRHLGGHGYLTNLDRGAIDWAIQEFDIKSMLDVGCGPGGMVELAVECGLDTHGIDGDYRLTNEWFDQSRFTVHDFQKGPAPIYRKYDLCWAVEFVEHVYERYIPNFVQAFQQCRVLFMTFATPGQGGYHHVNEQLEPYWLNTIENYGFQHHRDYSNKLREITTMNVSSEEKRTGPPYVKQTGLVFINLNWEGN